MRTCIGMEWHIYDTSELHAVMSEHGEIVKYDDDFWSCEDCCHDPRYAQECDVDITRAYRNLTRNLATVIALAASAQQEDEAWIDRPLTASEQAAVDAVVAQYGMDGVK